MQFLHNEQFFAAAQRKYVYIYDKRGLEVHCLKVRRQRLPLGTARPLDALKIPFLVALDAHLYCVLRAVGP